MLGLKKGGKQLTLDYWESRQSDLIEQCGEIPEVRGLITNCAGNC